MDKFVDHKRNKVQKKKSIKIDNMYNRHYTLFRFGILNVDINAVPAIFDKTKNMTEKKS